MKVSFTTNNAQFVSNDVPNYGNSYFANTMFPSVDRLYYPNKIVCNETYYKYYPGANQLIAFRVLAFSYNSIGELTCLIQQPNGQPKWIANFITTNSTIFVKRNDYFEFINGDKKLNIVGSWREDWSSFKSILLNNDYPLKNCVSNGGTIYASHYWDNKDNSVKRTETIIEHIFFTNEDCHICVKHKDGTFSTKEECLANKLNGLHIVEFAEEPFELKITILPNEPKISVLKIVEITS
jgi:hypothetical protein